MKVSTALKNGLLALAIVPTVLFAAGGKALAAQIPYDQGDTLPSLTSPVFNTFTNVPFGVGNEADFVRIRTSNGDPTSTGTNGDLNALYVDALKAACNAGDMFDVRTYIHNGADSDFNDNGNGPSIAHDVKLAMTATFGEDRTLFPFTSTLTASNAATVTDNASLTCNRTVRLELVPGTIKAYNLVNGWHTWMSESPINKGGIPIGSRNMDSGDVWGCWDERMQIVYTVKVVDVPTPPKTPETPKTPEAPKKVETPAKLPSTGAGNTIAIFTATSVLGAFLYRVKLLRSLR